MRWRQSSAYYLQSNGRAELAVKVAKRILHDNIGTYGSIDNDKVTRALLQFRKTPAQDIGLSPAQMLYGRTLRDCLPAMDKARNVRPERRVLAEDKERPLAKRPLRNIKTYSVHTTKLSH